MKNEIQLFDNTGLIIKGLKEQFLNGQIDPREYARLLKFSKQVETLTKDKKIKEMALEEFGKYPEGEGEFKGVEWRYKNGSGRYSYSHFEGWQKLKEQEDKLAELRRQLESKMKAAHKTDSTIIDEETGEVIPPATYTAYSDSISVK